MRTCLGVLLFGLLLGGGALAGDDVGKDVLEAPAKDALRQELLAAYRAQTHVNLAWDVVFTPAMGDESPPTWIRVEAYADGTHVAARWSSTTGGWSIDAVATPDQLFMVKGDLAMRMPSVRVLNEGLTRLAAEWKRLAQRFDAEFRPARVPNEPDEEPYRVAFGFVVDEAEDDSIDFDFDLVVKPGAEPMWLTEALFSAKDVTGPTGGRVVLRSARAELQVDVTTGMLLGGRVTKQRTGSVLTVERTETTVTPEAWQVRMQAVLARPVESISRQFSHCFFALMTSGVGFWVACTTTDLEEQAARLQEAVPKLVAAAFGGPDSLSAIDEWVGGQLGDDEMAGVAYLIAARWVAEFDRLTEDVLVADMLDEPDCLPDGLNADAAWARTRQAFRDAIRTLAAEQVDAHWPRKDAQGPSAAGDR